MPMQSYDKWLATTRHDQVEGLPERVGSPQAIRTPRSQAERSAGRPGGMPGSFREPTVPYNSKLGAPPEALRYSASTEAQARDREARRQDPGWHPATSSDTKFRLK